jgi:hypothetical protein
VGYNYGGDVNNCYSTGVVSGSSDSQDVGGLVGGNGEGSISDCYSTGMVIGTSDVGGLVGSNYYGSISDCYSTGSVSGSQFVGGLVGWNYGDGSISSCYSTGTVSGSNSVGGLVGWNYGDGSISSCYSTGAVSGSWGVGGLVGYNEGGSISNCYSTGDVSGGDNSYYLGGLVGLNYGTISNCYSTGAVTAGGESYDLGGLVGYNDGSISGCYFLDTSGLNNGYGTPLTDEQMKQQASFTGWDFLTIWNIVEGQTYPFFKSGGGTPDDPYRIATAEDLLAMAADTSNYDKCFILTADINMGGQVFTTAIIAADTIPDYDFQGTAFTGTFDGNGHKITNFTINGNDYLGLFGYINGLVKNLGLEDSTVSGSSSSYFVGGLVGLNYGTISNCDSTGSVSGSSGSSTVGGLVGYNEGGSISRCYSTGVVTGGDESYYLGGLVGYNDGSISNCYSTGSVSGSSDSQDVGGLVGYNYDSSISDCYSTGAVSGGSYVGGLVGYNSSGTLTDCYASGSVSGYDGVGGLVGYNDGSISGCYFLDIAGPSGYGTPLTDEEMKQQSSFVGWDFDGNPPIWKIQENITYPNLFWEPNVVIPQPQYTGGSGTSIDPYQIAKVADLQLLMASPADWDKYFIQTADINVQGIEMTPIGNDVNNFTGVFDGNDNIISNAVINQPSSDYIGLFGYVSGGQIRNLGVENVNITGNNDVGGLVGQNYGGTLTACYATGTVSGSSGSYYVGGLVGFNDYYGSISDCYSTGTVSGSNDSWYVGGLVGYNYYGSISNCYSTGTVIGAFDVGGLVGVKVFGSISDCYSTGAVSGSGNVGGLVGYNYYGSISNCYSTGAVSGIYDVGGLVGLNYGSISNCYFLDTSGLNNGYGTPLTDEEMKQQASFTGWNFLTIWDIVEGQTYPFFKSGGGTPDDPYRIATKADLLAMAADTSSYDKCFILTADIDMGGQVFTTAIIASGDVFTGTFDGNGHKITHFTINGGSNSCLGLFGYIYPGGAVKNLGLEDFAVSGYQYVGGLVGLNYGTISNCYSTGTVSGSNYSWCVGGLVGYNYYGSISNCYSTGTVSGYCEVGGLVGVNEYGSISNCYSTGSVSGYQYVGGLVGLNYGTISNCYSTGTVSGASDSQDVGGLVGCNCFGSISNCYSTGSVSGSNYVGGLVGYNTGGSVISSYFLWGAGPDNGYGTPLPDEEMKQQSSFVGWDFTTIWTICEGMNYPKLSWQIPPVGDFTCPDGVDFIDFAILANAWLSDPMQANWDLRCDIAEPPDSVIDVLDLAIFTQHWLEGL